MAMTNSPRGLPIILNAQNDNYRRLVGGSLTKGVEQWTQFDHMHEPTSSFANLPHSLPSKATMADMRHRSPSCVVREGHGRNSK